jgi:hypothetical protein
MESRDVREKNKEGRHVGLDFYDLLIEALKIPTGGGLGRSPQSAYPIESALLRTINRINDGRCPNLTGTNDLSALRSAISRV